MSLFSTIAADVALAENETAYARVLAFLNEQDLPVTCREVAEATGLWVEDVKSILHYRRRTGEVICVGKRDRLNLWVGG